MHSKFVWINHHDDTMYGWEGIELFRPLLYCSRYQLGCLLFSLDGEGLERLRVELEDWPLTSSLLCDETRAQAYPAGSRGGHIRWAAGGTSWVLGFERLVTRQFADPIITISKE